MTTAPIKTTAELAKESDSRKAQNTAAIQPTGSDSPTMDGTLQGSPGSEPDISPTISDVSKSSQQSATEAAAGDDKEVSPEQQASANTPKQETTKATDPVTIELLNVYETELNKLGFKNIVKLYELRGHLNRAKKAAVELESELAGKIDDMLSKVAGHLEENKGFQDQLHTTTEALLDKLKVFLEEGQSHEALPAWDKIQGNISNTSGKIRAELHEKAASYKAKINELREWKIFAATEKKKELITQMQHLLDSKMHASDRSKHISTMHKEWKTLGRSNENEELWKEFKTLSDKAYEPCKEYFKQRKQLMAENFKQRRALCDQLEQDIAAIDAETVNIGTVNKLLKNIEESWKKYAPVEQSKIKNLQKRYYELLNKLRKLRRNEMRTNAKAKQQCIQDAIALSKLEDNKKAMGEAKTLQQHWKKIGPTTFKEDRKYWDEFRSACDKIFEQRNLEAEKIQQDLKENEASLKTTLQSLEKLFTLEEEAFRASRPDYQTLAQQFSNNLSPRLKQQGKILTNQFNSLKRKIDMRFKALPDKKFLQIKEKLSVKTALLQGIEKDLFNLRQAEQFSEYMQSMSPSQWNELPKVGDEVLDGLLNGRWQSLQKLKNPQDFTDLVNAKTEEFRKQCIELEIRANIESPDSDQATRMEIQLSQLKNAFGRSKPDRQENAKLAKQIQVQSLCFGPIDPSSEAALTSRLSAAISRLS